MFCQLGGNLHGAGEHTRRKGSWVQRNLHNKREQADTADQQKSWLSDSLHNPGSRIIHMDQNCSFQVNQYEDIHGGRPFASAPDDLVTEVALKRF